MSLETALLSALSAVTAALCWIVRIMYARLVKAEERVSELQNEVEVLQRENGHSSATVEMFRKCPKRKECPFAVEFVS
jgi:cell division protein FtsB